MITNEYLTKRMWGHYPALQKLLQNKKLPDKYFGHTSISDNIFDKTTRLLTLLYLVLENANEFDDLGMVRTNELLNDLQVLTREIRLFSNYLTEENGNINELVEKLRN